VPKAASGSISSTSRRIGAGAPGIGSLSPLHDHHLSDSLNGEQPPFCGGTDEDDLLVLRTVDRASTTEAPVPRTVASFVTPRVVVGVRP